MNNLDTFIQGLKNFSHSGKLEGQAKNKHTRQIENRTISAEHLKKIYKENKISLILGAGVSVKYNLPDWNVLLDNLWLNNTKQALQLETSIYKYIRPSSSIISARLLRRKDKFNLEEEIQKLLYQNISNVTSNLIKSLIEIIYLDSECKVSNIITYNYDDILEVEMTKYCNFPNFNCITQEKQNYQVNKVNIYHVHGFLPRDGQNYTKIVLTEEDYHSQYQSIYSWQNLAQLDCFRNTSCIFIGISLSDPNMRRLLDISRNTSQFKHHILKKKYSIENIKKGLEKYILDLNEINDASQISELKACLNDDIRLKNIIEVLCEFEDRDAASLNVQNIWFDSYDDIPDFIQSLK